MMELPPAERVKLLAAPNGNYGKPLDKLGLRGLNQGEFYFDSVEVPTTHLLAGPDEYEELAYRSGTARPR